MTDTSNQGDLTMHPEQPAGDSLLRQMQAVIDLLPDPTAAWTRTIVCPPEREPAVRAAVESLRTTEHFAIRTSRYLPDPNTVLILDDEAIEGPLTRGFGVR